MQQNTISLAPAAASVASCCLTQSRQFIRSHDNVLLSLSLVLLVLSSAENGPLGTIVKLLWLASVASLTFINIGAAFAAYIDSLAIYSPFHFQSWGTPLERPDNYALVLVLAGLLGLAFNKVYGWTQSDSRCRP